jgi:hypothetical protein
MKTKQIIFTISLMIFACYHIQAQDKLQYRSLKSFNNDTINYLKYNFYTLRSQYEGKTIADVIKNIKLPIIKVIPISIAKLYEGKEKPESELPTIPSIHLRILNDGTDIAIHFTEPIEENEYIEAITSADGSKSKKMTTKLYNFLKDKKVKSVYANPIALEQVKQLRKNNN